MRLDKASPDATDFTVLDVPAGRALAFPDRGQRHRRRRCPTSPWRAWSPRRGFAPGDVKPIVARFETFDGLVVEASTYKLPAGVRVRFNASADPALAERFAPKPAEKPPTRRTAAATAPPVPDAEKRKSFDEVKAEADQLNARLGNWVYSLPDFKAEQLTKKLEDLLQPVSPKKPPSKKSGTGP